MRLLFFLSLLVFSFSAFASLEDVFSGEAIGTVCENTVQEHPGQPGFWLENNPRFFKDSSGEQVFLVQSRIGANGRFWTLFKISKSQPNQLIFLADLDQKVNAIELVQDKLWVLQRDRLIAFDPVSGKVLQTLPSYHKDLKVDRHSRAHDMAVFKNRLYIAHGSKGLVVRSAESGELLGKEDYNLLLQPGGHRSKVMSIAINESVAVLGIDNLTQPTQQNRALNGLIKFNPDLIRVHSRHAYDPKPNAAGVIAYARLALEGSKLYVNNLGNLQTFETNGLPPVIRPTWKRLSAELLGRDRNIRPHGDLLVEGSKVYGCGSIYTGDVEGQPEKVAVVIVGQ